MTRFVAATPDAPARQPLYSRVVDPGAIGAAFVGIGLAMTVGVSFLLVIPIEPVYWALSVPAGLLIGYYADTRSGRRRGEWRRIIANAFLAGLATGLTLATLFIAVKALFFYADDGYQDSGTHITCTRGADCVYQRYLVQQGDDLVAAGITDAATFGTYYWSQQWNTALLIVILATGSGVAGGAIYGINRPKIEAGATTDPGTAPQPQPESD